MRRATPGTGFFRPELALSQPDAYRSGTERLSGRPNCPLPRLAPDENLLGIRLTGLAFPQTGPTHPAIEICFSGRMAAVVAEPRRMGSACPLFAALWRSSPWVRSRLATPSQEEDGSHDHECDSCAAHDPRPVEHALPGRRRTGDRLHGLQALETQRGATLLVNERQGDFLPGRAGTEGTTEVEQPVTPQCGHPQGRSDLHRRRSRRLLHLDRQVLDLIIAGPEVRVSMLGPLDLKGRIVVLQLRHGRWRAEAHDRPTTRDFPIVGKIKQRAVGLLGGDRARLAGGGRDSKLQRLRQSRSGGEVDAVYHQHSRAIVLRPKVNLQPVQDKIRSGWNAQKPQKKYSGEGQRERAHAVGWVAGPVHSWPRRYPPATVSLQPNGMIAERSGWGSLGPPPRTSWIRTGPRPTWPRGTLEERARRHSSSEYNTAAPRDTGPSLLLQPSIKK